MSRAGFEPAPLDKINIQRTTFHSDREFCLPDSARGLRSGPAARTDELSFFREAFTLLFENI